MFEIAVACLVITALLAYMNARFVGLPTTIGVMALSLPAGPYRDLILALTYAVVVFSILVQGLTVKPLVKAVGS